MAEGTVRETPLATVVGSALREWFEAVADEGGAVTFRSNGAVQIDCDIDLDLMAAYLAGRLQLHANLQRMLMAD